MSLESRKLVWIVIWVIFCRFDCIFSIRLSFHCVYCIIKNQEKRKGGKIKPPPNVFSFYPYKISSMLSHTHIYTHYNLLLFSFLHSTENTHSHNCPNYNTCICGPEKICKLLVRLRSNAGRKHFNWRSSAYSEIRAGRFLCRSGTTSAAAFIVRGAGEGEAGGGGGG